MTQSTDVRKINLCGLIFSAILIATLSAFTFVNTHDFVFIEAHTIIIQSCFMYLFINFEFTDSISAVKLFQSLFDFKASGKYLHFTQSLSNFLVIVSESVLFTLFISIAAFFDVCLIQSRISKGIFLVVNAFVICFQAQKTKIIFIFSHAKIDTSKRKLSK
jgi:hypothetical protein